ncbi:MAG TPA: hypothetical protein VFX02_03360 [Gammaproteobacteria bacterium]|nr:hypothetical protein [Gammaproteobacteria bacterium]
MIKKFHLKLVELLVIPVIVGIILLVIQFSFFEEASGPEENKTTNPIVVPKSFLDKKEDDKIEVNKNRFLIQTGRTYELFDGNLTLSLTSVLNFSNSEIDLVVSARGKEPQIYKDLSMGQKIFFGSYEITFLETQKNLTTYDVWLRIEKL